MQTQFIRVIFGVLVLGGGLTSGISPHQVAASVTQSQPSQVTHSSTVSFRGISTTNYAYLEWSVYQKINQYRQSQNLPPLAWNSAIAQQARSHSRAMASGQVPLGHDGFNNRTAAIAQSIPYSSVAENVAYTSSPSNPDHQVVQAWLQSSSHLQNIRGNYDLTGISVSQNAQGGYYFTQIFLKRR